MTAMAGSFSGALLFPSFEGQPNSSVPFNAAFTFTKKVEIEDEVTGTGTKTISLSAFGANGAKFVAVWFKASSAVVPAPIEVNVNGGSSPMQLSVGGWLSLFNPTPAGGDGILSIEIDHTAEAEIAVWAFA